MRSWPKDSPLRRPTAGTVRPGDSKVEAKESRRVRCRRSQRDGQQTEDVVILHMRATGFRCVEPVETGWRIRWRDGKVIDAKPRAKVACDITAVAPLGGACDGRSVRVEVKSRPETLSFTDLETHQRARLKDHFDAGGISLIAWKHERGISLILWEQFTYACSPGHPLKVSDALRMDPRTLRS